MLPWPIYAHLLSFIMMLVRTQGSWRRLLLIAVRTQHALTGKKISFASMSNIFYSKDNQLKIGFIFIREAVKKWVFYLRSGWPLLISSHPFKNYLRTFVKKCLESHLSAFVGQIRQGARIRGVGWVNPILAMPGFWVHMDPQPIPNS